MRRRQFLTGIALGTMVLAGCSSDMETTPESGEANGGNNDGANGEAETTTSTATTEATEDEPPVEILEHEWYQEEYQAGVRGIAQNNTDQELSYVEVEVVFLNSDDVQIGSFIDNTNDLAAGRKWQFDVLFTGNDADEVETYEISVGEGF